MNKQIKIILFALFILALAFLAYQYWPSNKKINNIALASCSVKSPDSTLSLKKNPTLGNFYGDGKCMTIYTYIDDRPNESVCYEGCFEVWMPYLKNTNQNVINYPEINSDLSDDPSKLLTTFSRKDDTMQYAIDNKPLYYFSGDKSINDTKGNKLENGKWGIITHTSSWQRN